MAWLGRKVVMGCHILITHVSAKIIPLISMPVVLSTQQQHQEKLVLGSISRSADTIDLGFLGRIGISIKFLDAVDLGTTL